MAKRRIITNGPDRLAIVANFFGSSIGTSRPPVEFFLADGPPYWHAFDIQTISRGLGGTGTRFHIEEARHCSDGYLVKGFYDAKDKTGWIERLAEEGED